MAVLTGKNSDIYIATGSGTGMTGEATTSLGSNVYQITDSAKRAINPNAALTVLDGVTTVSPGDYQVFWATGKIAFTGSYTVGGSVTVTGEYLSLSQAAQGYEWSLDTELTLEETQTFGDSWKERTAITRSASVTFARFYDDEYFHTNLGSVYVLRLYTDQPGDAYYGCGAHVASSGVQSGENEVIRENVSFTVTGGLDYVNA
jgi:hypothetical protein